MGNTSSSIIQQQSSDIPRPCSRGCGFYGAPEYQGACSKCFQDSHAPLVCSFQDSHAPRVCSRGCGFYGSAANSGMCSKCFKDYQNEMARSEAGRKKGYSGQSKIKIQKEDGFSDAVITEMEFMERLEHSKKMKNLR